MILIIYTKAQKNILAIIVYFMLLLHGCNSMVQASLDKLKVIQRDMESIQNSTRKFILWDQKKIADSNDYNNSIEIEEEFPAVRRRYNKKFFDEQTRDKQPKAKEVMFKVTVYNVIMGMAIESMPRRFGKIMELCRDISMLYPNSFE